MTDLDTVNIASHLPAMAARQPEAIALHLPDGRRYTFRELDEASNAAAAGLRDLGIAAGMRTVLMVPPGGAFFVMVFALFRLGAVPVMIDPGLGLKNLRRCLEEVEPEAFVGVPKAQWARRLFGWGRRTLRHCVTVTESRIPRGNSPPIMAAPGDLAAILFTSGSTGPPKGVAYTHANFNAQVAALRDLYGIEPGEIDLCTFPLFALYAPALGMTAVVPKMNFTRPGRVNPRNIIDPVNRYKATNLFGSPALLRRISQTGERMPTLRRVISAGAPVSVRVIEWISWRLAPGGQVFTPYGATEALPVCSIGSDEILGEDPRQGICVGRPAPSIELAIIRITDDAIPEWSEALRLPHGEIGEICVKGPQVTSAYFNRFETTMMAKIIEENGDLWHRMGDLGYRDAQGRIWFSGRKSQRVVIGDITMHTIPCEAIFNADEHVERSALVQAHGRPVICIERSADARLTEHITRDDVLALAQSHERTRAIRDVLFHRSFPVDVRHNAKIGREKLAQWAERKLRR